MRMGRRRSSAAELCESLHKLQALSTCEESPTQDRKVSAESSIAETVIAMDKMPPRPLCKIESHDDSESTDASLQPLLAVPAVHHKPKK